MDKYSGFEDLPAEVAERLKRQIISGKRVCTQISKDATPQEISDAFLEDTKNPDYNYKQLAQIVDAFTLFNNAVGRLIVIAGAEVSTLIVLFSVAQP